jgi:uncharacterized RDD family membrane protein YckC/Tfp pilus assembly major pilin PilA
MARLPNDDWYYGGAHAPEGPVSQPVLRALRARGAIGDGTSVWNAGHAAGAWLPYAEVFGRVASAAGMTTLPTEADALEPPPPPPLPVTPDRALHAVPLRHEQAPSPAEPDSTDRPDDHPDLDQATVPPPRPPTLIPRRPSPALTGEAATQRHPASFLRRWAALFLDGLIIGIPLQIVILVIAIASGLDMARTDIEGAVYLVVLAAWGSYFILMEGTRGATLGKQILEVTVVDTRGAPIGIGRALARHVTALLNYVTLYLGYLIAALTPRRQGLHDMLAGTMVVYREPGRVPSTTGCAIAIVGGVGSLIVLGIVAAIAIPAYVDYTTRARVAEGLAAIEPLKRKLAAQWLESGELYDSVDDVPDYDPPGVAVVRSIDIANGTIVLTFPTTLDGEGTVALEPVRTGETITWLCGHHRAPKDARRITNTRASGRTTLKPSLLPPACRR